MSDNYPDLTVAAQTLEEAYEKIGDLGGSAAEVKLTVSWISPGGREMNLSIGDLADADDDMDELDDDIDYSPDEDELGDDVAPAQWSPQGDPTRYQPGHAHP